MVNYYLVTVFNSKNTALSATQGRIGCANVLSDLYAMGVHHCRLRRGPSAIIPPHFSSIWRAPTVKANDREEMTDRPRTSAGDNMLMVLAASEEMKPDHRKICTAEMIRGFRSAPLQRAQLSLWRLRVDAAAA
jgi:hypothetical protein